MIPQGAAALVAARRLPWVVTAHGGDVYALNDPLSRRVKSAVLRHSRAVTERATCGRGWWHSVRIPRATTVLPMGVDVERFRAAAARSADFSIESTGLRYRRVLQDAMRPR